jgi:ABC-type antimicrobial peptide transport system permease subunit
LLRAIGVRASSLVRALLTQVTVIVLVGVMIGGGLAWLTLNAAGNSLGARVAGRDLVTTGAIVLVLALVAALGAARRVLGIDPIRATVPGGLD